MAQAKYKQYYQQMKEENQDLFAEFKEVHDDYEQNPDELQEQFNQQGKPVVKVIRDWERRLCRAMGKGKYSKYTQNLSEKFWDLVREEFAKIDMVGLKIEK